jgi:NADH-quinone oxidoreductase subunit J
VSVESVIFYCVAAAAVITAVLMTLQRNPLMSAICLIANFFCIAALYLILQAQFLAVIQIVVYAGAIMVLVVFVIMLLNLGDEAKLTERLDIRKVAGTTLVFGLLLELLYLVGFADMTPSARGFPLEATDLGTVESIGSAMFTQFLFPFEITSLLLLAAIIGAIILAKKRV